LGLSLTETIHKDGPKTHVEMDLQENGHTKRGGMCKIKLSLKIQRRRLGRKLRREGNALQRSGHILDPTSYGAALMKFGSGEKSTLSGGRREQFKKEV